MTSSKIWLVTGANRGLGLEIAKTAVAAGHIVIGTYRSSKNTLPSAADIGKTAGGTLSWIQLDVSSDDVESKVNEVVQKHGKIDVLVNNAGYGLAGTVENTSIDAAMQLFQVNYFGTVRTIRAVTPSMREHGGGSIVNIGSSDGIKPHGGTAHYSASKHAVEGMTEALQAEVASFNIRVLMVEPGGLATDFTDVSKAGVAVPLGDAYKGTMADFVMQALANVDEYKKQAGSPGKAALRIVEAVDGTGMLAGKEIGLRLPLGTAGNAMSEKAKEYADVMGGLKEVCESI